MNSADLGALKDNKKACAGRAMTELNFSRANSMSRREFVRVALGAGTFALTGEFAMADSSIRKPIPKTGESLLAVGLGTWQTFDVGAGQSSREPLKEGLREDRKSTPLNPRYDQITYAVFCLYTKTTATR